MRNLVIVFLFLSTSLILITFFVGVSRVYPKPILGSSSPHLYDNPSASIKSIELTVFYFIPKDRIQNQRGDWKIIADSHLKKLQEFHTLQFSGKSKITYTLFPEVIIGQKNGKEYESTLGDDNPDALLPIKQEITARVLTKGDNLYALNLKKEKDGTRQVYLVIFEGDGGAGKDDYALIARSYLTDKIYETYGTTFLAHEFYHTLGLPDDYQKVAYEQTTTSLLTSKDIMGEVDIPISNTYIDKESLKKMGL